MSFKDIKNYTDKQADKEYKKRLKALTPTVFSIVKHVAGKIDSLPIGDVNAQSEEYLELTKEVMQLMLQNNINWLDMQYTAQLAIQPFSLISQIIQASEPRTRDLLWTALCNKPVQELTMQEVDELLKKGAPLMEDYLEKLELDGEQKNDDVV